MLLLLILLLLFSFCYIYIISFTFNRRSSETGSSLFKKLSLLEAEPIFETCKIMFTLPLRGIIIQLPIFSSFYVLYYLLCLNQIKMTDVCRLVYCSNLQPKFLSHERKKISMTTSSFLNLLFALDDWRSVSWMFDVGIRHASLT
uniref:Uncharacterized protein n=1 Tax=Ixodes scapularis TaxID=6945 RepID=A0A4D5RAQ3_IXOSC